MFKTKGDNKNIVTPSFNKNFHEEIIATVDIKNPDVISRLTDRYPDLTEKDILICCLLVNDFDTGMIASMFDIHPDSVNTHRYRIRAKLGLETTDNLKDFLLSV
jgi:AraC family chitin signaling transcriptional activator